MTIRQVLLNGTGTSGDGTTWNDLSDPTSAYIGAAGYIQAWLDSSPGDIIYFKGDGSQATVINVAGPQSTALIKNPVQALACKPTTTNNQGSIVTSDLIPGQRTGAAAGTYAFDDAGIPKLHVTGNADLFHNPTGYIYGMSLSAGDDCLINGLTNLGAFQIYEECLFAVTGSVDILRIGSGEGSHTKLVNCKISLPTGAFLRTGEEGRVTFLGGEVSKVNNNFIDSGTVSIKGETKFHGSKFSGGALNLVDVDNLVGRVVFDRCEFPSGYSLTTGVGEGNFSVENYGSDSDTSGITTSEQNFEIAQLGGTLASETVKVRTGGADDEAAGAFSVAMNTIAGNTTPGTFGLHFKMQAIWVAGDGLSKNLELYFTSDSGNTNTADWQNDEVWPEVNHVSEAGGSRSEFKSEIVNLLATPADVDDDTISVWPAGTARPQKMVIPIAPDYEGFVVPTVHFASGANAETIYVDPLPKIA